MKREEILKVYEAGPEAVVELAESLLERIKQLEDQVNKNSRNSSKPPSKVRSDDRYGIFTP
ncbi:MAG: DUF6444 domain-containing protein [Desulfitobacteriaceae bacterium]|nr:DUF6444 domain-containing protein [Desulfitobacteriaceae bacterium]MDI6879436.1 DUF6444 domain-containing protein [Desulfitobacteriaceae bacterium]MDI6915039.1 DUF6444 domain-containing protein [Desulfitobacteriaceae bacterium]